ncbi:MAG: ketopantoate reductase family protein [Promethearchaeota archaeon]
MNKINIRIGFIGAGSIGSLFGGYIANIKSDIYNLKVIFFCKKDQASIINKKGLIINKNKAIKEIKNIEAYENEKNFEEKLKKDPDLKFNFIFLTTKAYDIKNALFQYKNIINPSKWLVILQNGIGNEDIAGDYCSKLKIIRAITTNGALLKEPGQLYHTGEGITKIGFPFLNNFNLEPKYLEKANEDLVLLKDILNSAKLETIIVQDIIKVSWEKVFVNIGINAIGTLTRLRNGQLLEFDGLRDFMRKAINEAIRVAELKKINFSKKDYISLAFDVAKSTAENKNSMLQDIIRGKITEIDFINGRILKYAKELEIDVPTNEILTELIKGLEYSIR